MAGGVTLPADAVDAPASGGLPPDAVDAPKGSDHTAFGSALQEYWDKVNPVTQIKGIAHAVAHPIDTAVAGGQQDKAMLDKAVDAMKNGRYSEGVQHALGYLIPGIGGSLDEIADKARKGDYAGAGADTAALATNLVAPAAIAKGAGAAASAAGNAARAAVGAIPEISPAAADVAGLVSPRAAHALRIMGRIQHAIGKPVEQAVAEAPEAVEPAPNILKGEAPPPERPAWRQDIVNELQPKPAEPVPAATPAEKPPAASREAVNRDKLAHDLADFLHSEGNGISHEDALRMGPDQWKMARSAVRQGYKPASVSPATQKAALEYLRQLQNPEPSPATAPLMNVGGTSLTGRPLAIASDLAREMVQ